MPIYSYQISFILPCDSHDFLKLPDQGTVKVSTVQLPYFHVFV